jgi:pSer/pThr/pTyr-binding forkhead associated (FHA) protein
MPISPTSTSTTASERRVAARPQAPEVLPTPGPAPTSIAPRVEVVRRMAAAAAVTSEAHDEGTWGKDTSGKIPLRPVGAESKRSKEELMDQAKNYVCRSCSTPIPSGHKFCGRCGAAVPPDILSLREEYYGSLQIPGRAKLILIRAEGDAAMEGLSFALNAQEHIVGRQGHLTFPEDRYVSPRHANLFYREGTLVVRDEGSVNGVYVRIRGGVEAQVGDMFLAGEEVFRIDPTPKATDHPEADGTYFWSSPKRPSPFRIVQILQGGSAGNTVCAREAGVTIGREGGEMNFPADVYMSATHCRIESDPSGKLTLTDLNSRNGTYLRMRGERELHHGDYVFIGKKILRVEVTS